MLWPTVSMIKVLLKQMMSSTETVISVGVSLVTLRGLEDVSKLSVPSTVPVRNHVTWLRLTLTGTAVSRPQTAAYLSQYA